MSGMNWIIYRLAQDQSIYFEVLDSSAVSTGGRLTGLAFDTAGLTAYYVHHITTPTAITLTELAAVNSAYSEGGFIEIDATNMPGLYRLDIPNSVYDDVESLVITLQGAANMVPVSIFIQLVYINPQDNIRAGMEALPNAFAGANDGLPTSNVGKTSFNDLSAADVRAAVGMASANLDTQLTTIDDYIDTEVAAIKAKTDLIPGTTDGYTWAQHLALQSAALLGKASGMATTTATFRSANDSADRIVATVDADGNRSAVTLTP